MPHTDHCTALDIAELAERVRSQRAESARAVARHLKRRLDDLGWPARRQEHGFTVVMRRPPYAVRQRWRLAYQQDEAHVVCMPGVTREQIDAFIVDLAAARATAN